MTGRVGKRGERQASTPNSRVSEKTEDEIKAETLCTKQNGENGKMVGKHQLAFVRGVRKRSQWNM